MTEDLAASQPFADIVSLIQESRRNVLKNVNAALIDLYWNIGASISQKMASGGWGKGIISHLAAYIQQQEPELKGFSDKNLWRMKQFYETYCNEPKLSALLREISWTHNLSIMARCKTIEERDFYLRLSKSENYSSRELDRQISSGLYERTRLAPLHMSSALKEQHPSSMSVFRDSYVFEFLNVSASPREQDLQKEIIAQLKLVMLEFGRDFLFMGEEFRLQVGSQDFFVDLLFYHRQLQCLVALELKTDTFRPDYLGQLSFYLEALDRDVKKPHENPSIGILLCKDKDSEVVEYALSRNLSPALVAEYTIQLPDKKLLQTRLHEMFSASHNPSTDPTTE